MASKNKTQANDADVISFINSIENTRRREDGLALLEIYKQVTGQQPKMWGSSIIGFGRYTYTLASGKQEQFLRSGFSPRKQNLSIYVAAFLSENSTLLDSLGKHKTSKACLYINRLADVDLDILKQIIDQDLTIMDTRYPA
ncbi:MAG: DUF1801 domain-containing protein [Aliiglaciecola sp.]|uniref:DUF1801 domain-containing protein n=1 Tax=Aliiglaciecola sp. TaxID=1872441 RepID=UPI003296919F